MLMNKKALILGVVAGVMVAPAVWAAGFFTNGVPNAGGTQFPTTVPLTGNEQLPADTELPNGQQPQSEAITVGQLLQAASGGSLPTNQLSNGQMAINQQGTGVITGGTTTVTALQFAADRWFIDTNVTSGTGRGQVITATPAPPQGFAQSFKLYRNSAALLQPVCTLQALTTQPSTQLQGQYVVLSAYVQALAGLTATAGQVNAYIISGTGADEGLATLTASPAITPAWTGLAGGTTANATWTTTTSWVRYNTPPVLIPATATEVGVEICFTPVGSASGTTDGIALTGIQLESVPYNASPAPAVSPGPSPFEFHTNTYDLLDAQKFYVRFNEPASGAGMPAMCQATGSATGICTLYLPTKMRGTTPVVAIPTTGTYAVNIAGTPTTWVTPTAGTCSLLACTITIGNTNTNGQALTLTGGAGGTGVVYVKSDVVM